MAFEARLGSPGVATAVAQEGRVVTLVADHLAPGEGQSPRAGEHAVPMSRSPATQPRTTIFLKNDCQEVELFPMSNFGPEVDIRPGQLLEELRIVPTGDSPHPADRDGESTEDPHSLVAAGTSPSTTSPVDSPDAANSADTILEIEDGETTLFEAAIGAFHAGEFQRAESLFLEEAERTLDAAPQRAAIAFRQAALAAREAGNIDGSDHWMRLAGREYLRVSEDDRTPLPFIRESALMAAKCFLSVENLHVASKGLRRAQAIETVLRVDDDLMAGVPGIPFRHDEVGSAATVRPDGATDAVEPVVGPTSPIPGKTRAGFQTTGTLPSTGRPGATARLAGWLQRFRHHRPSRNVA